MKDELTYSDAYIKLERIVAELEDDNIPLDKLSAKVEQANGLISICENKLRKTEMEVNETIEKTSKTRKMTKL